MERIDRKRREARARDDFARERAVEDGDRDEHDGHGAADSSDGGSSRAPRDRASPNRRGAVAREDGDRERELERVPALRAKEPEDR